jgi:uncharacterized protein
MNTHISTIASELKLAAKQVTATLSLLDDDATVPFIARYRKEATGELDEVAVTAIRDRVHQLRELDKRRTTILKSLEGRDLLTDKLATAINIANTLAELEDIYLPFRPKRRTRATIARERGLEPLAEMLFEQEDFDPVAEAEQFVDVEKEVPDAESALSGARDIIAEWINEDTETRARMRKLFAEQGIVKSTVIGGKEEQAAKYSDYFQWHEPITAAPSHRVLAMRRGEAEGFLSLTFRPETEQALPILEDIFLISENRAADQVLLAIEDSYKRLLAPAMETEIRSETKSTADVEAIHVFAANIRELLMAPPLGQKSVMAIDPGFRTGCKVVCLDRQGQLLYNTTIFPTSSDHQRSKAEGEVRGLCTQYKISVIAVGNGTAGRETESFLRNLDLPGNPSIEMVNESGASIYSASEVARAEFPDHDITVRGAVSIGRRLMDALAELVKIDPKSIGVGQYQHDVDQTALKGSLDDTVMSCVNAVGVEVNTASKELLTYVSGLGGSLAQNIVTYRNENGPFGSRSALKKVARLGPKAFEQSAGFLRIRGAKNPLDQSAVHPESYPVVKQMADNLGCTVKQLMNDEQHRDQVKLHDYVSDTVGLPTLQDIMDEIAKPGRDPRPAYESFSFDDSVNKMEELEKGMKLPGIVTNVTAFGAFVDIGVHQDGLVHISQLADKFVNDPSEIVKVQQKVTVTVMEIDLPRKRISLSMREGA